MLDLKLGVVCPVFNETGELEAICRALAARFDIVIVVDDGSDPPLQLPGAPSVKLLRHVRNKGKGRALETGLRACLEYGCDVIATVDGDGEHDPRSFDRVLPLAPGDGMVILSRHLFFREAGLFRAWRNRRISRRLSQELGITIRDTQSGMRVFTAPALQAALARGLPAGYAVETEMLRAARYAGFSVTERPMIRPSRLRNKKRYTRPGVLLSDLVVFLRLLLLSDEPTSGPATSKIPSRRSQP